MIKMAGNIEILCGALADQTAREVERSGIFTRKLLEILVLPHDPPLLALPLDPTRRTVMTSSPISNTSNRRCAILGMQRRLAPACRSPPECSGSKRALDKDHWPCLVDRIRFHQCRRQILRGDAQIQGLGTWRPETPLLR